MSKLFSRIVGYFSNRTPMGVDKAGNRYFARKEEIDGVMKEKRWVVFKGEDDTTSIPVKWICWLNGQHKKAPMPEEIKEWEARRERVRQNVAHTFLKKEEEEKKLKEGGACKGTSIGKVAGPDLRSFIRQFPGPSEGDKVEEETDTTEGARHHTNREAEKARIVPHQRDLVKHTDQGHGNRRHDLFDLAFLLCPQYRKTGAKFAENTLAIAKHSSCS